MKFYKNRYGGRRAVPYWPTRHGRTDGRTDEHDEADLRMHLATKHSWGKTCLHYRHGCKLRLSPPWDQVALTQFLLWMMATKREVLYCLEYVLKIVAPCIKSHALCPASPYVHCILNICLARISLVPDVRRKLISDSYVLCKSRCEWALNTLTCHAQNYGEQVWKIYTIPTFYCTHWGFLKGEVCKSGNDVNRHHH